MALFKRRPRRQSTNRGMSVTERKWSTPPDRNTQEWLAAYGANPRLAPVSKIAQDLASASGKLYRQMPDGTRDEVIDHPFLDFWQRPNPLPWLTANAIWRLLEIYHLLKGEAYAIIERGPKGQPAELWPIPPSWVMEIPCAGQDYYVVQGQNGLREQIGLRDMYILRDLKPLDPYNRGLGQAEAVADEIETYEYSIKYSKSFYYNDASSPLIFAADVNEEQIRQFQEAFSQRHKGLYNAHKPAVIPRKDVTILKATESPKELDFNETRKDLRDAINSHFGVPPELMGIVENSNRATATVAKTIYAENVLMPLLRQRQDAVNLQLLSQFGDDSLVWEYDDIIPKDEEYTLQVANEGLSRSALLINEWREQMGFDPLPNGDVLLVGGMLVAYGRDEPIAMAQPGTPPAPPTQSDPGPPGTPPLDGDVQQVQVAKDVSLNGAQITSLVQVVQAVNAGELARESGIEIITSAFPFDRAKAEAILSQPVAPGPEGAAPNPPAPISETGAP